MLIAALPDIDYPTRRLAGDRFMPHIRYLCGYVFFEVADWHNDALRATDLIGESHIRIAARVRSHTAYQSWPYDFTLRLDTEFNRTVSEFHKILSGWGDYMFYGFENDGATMLGEWRFLRLGVFRSWLLHTCFIDKSSPIYEVQANGNGQRFLSFDVRKFPSELVLAHGNGWQLTKELHNAD